MASRRDFFLFPAIVPASAMGLNGAIPPSDHVTLATIGTGWMGGDHVKLFVKIPGVRYVALCDLDELHLSEYKALVDRKYGDQGCAAYRAFDEVLARNDIDAVTIAVPDHWHGIVAVNAARAGKEIYCEKPLAHNFLEGLAMVKESERRGRIWQTGSWQRSTENFRQAVELVRNGVIGKVHTVEVGLPVGHTDFANTKTQTQFTAPPATLFYDRWLGAAPEAPYCAARVHKNWRWNYDYAGGQLMDWVGHHVDIAHWGMDWDQTGPLEIEGAGEFPSRDALWNTATKYKVTARYPGGVVMIIAGGDKEIRGGTKWIGSDGWVWVNRGRIGTSNPEWLKEGFKAGPLEIPKSPGHYEQFIECVKSRAKTLTPASVALRSATPGWLGNIAMMTGRKLKWDPVKMEIADDPGASAMLGRSSRAPWRLA